MNLNNFPSFMNQDSLNGNQFLYIYLYLEGLDFPNKNKSFNGNSTVEGEKQLQQSKDESKKSKEYKQFFEKECLNTFEMT